MHAHDTLRQRFFSLYNGVVAFHDWCDLRYLAAEADDTRLVMPFLPRLADKDGAIAATMAPGLADVAAGQAAAAAFGWSRQVATVSLQQAVLKPFPPGKGLLAKGRALAVRGDFVLTEVAISAEDAPDEPLVLAQGRMIAMRSRESAVEAAAPSFPPRTEFAADPLLGPEGLVSEMRDGVLHGRLAFKPHFMGNASRGALHGGLIAAALHTAANRFGAELPRPLSLCDVTVDYLAGGKAGDLYLKIESERTGSRVAFISGHAEQDVPEGGRRVIARMSGTLTLSP